jgi:hypothetical protein
MRVKAESFFKMSVRNYPTKRRNNTEDLLPQQLCSGNLKSLFWFAKNIFLSDRFIFLISCVWLLHDPFAMKE